MLCTLKYVEARSCVVFLTKKKKKLQKNAEKVLEVIGMFSTLIVVMVSWVHTYVQTDQDVYIKCAQYFVYQLCLNKAK